MGCDVEEEFVSVAWKLFVPHLRPSEHWSASKSGKGEIGWALPKARQQAGSISGLMQGIAQAAQCPWLKFYSILIPGMTGDEVLVKMLPGSKLIFSDYHIKFSLKANQCHPKTELQLQHDLPKTTIDSEKKKPSQKETGK